MNVIKLVGGPHLSTFKVLDKADQPIDGIRSVEIDRIDVETGIITATINAEVQLDMEVQVRKEDDSD